MEISERASLIFNNNGSIVVRHAFQTRDGKFHDIVVTDGEHKFQKKDWAGCEKILLKKIWVVYSECIQAIQKHDDLKKFAPEQVRFVYSKNPSKSNPDRTKLFINSLNSSLPPMQHPIGHLPKINEELEIFSDFLLKPHAKVLPPKPEPAVTTTTTKAPKLKKDTPEKPAEPGKKTAEPAKPIVAGGAGTPPKPAVTLPPVKPKDDPAGKPAATSRSALTLPPPVRCPIAPAVDPLVERHKSVAKKILSRAGEVLGSAFKRKPLQEHLLPKT